MDDGLIRVFNKQEGKASLGTEIIGKKIYCYDSVTSTNDIVHFLARDGEPEGSVVFARGQTQGRGRQGGPWVSPYNLGLYFSFLLRPMMTPQEASRITLTVALAVAKALDEMHIEGIVLKWPNDILLHEKKVCGILTELSLQGAKIKYAVVGVGLNVNAPAEDLPSGSVSLKMSAARTFDIADLSHIIIRQIDHHYALLLDHRFEEILRQVRGYSGLILGGRVRVSWQDTSIEGYAVDFDDRGGLVIRRDNGLMENVSSGHLEKLIL
jgi:BirA family biotin operon repressor/biotin-[acetyl-CoA-carboxylase] ligase